MRHRPGWLLGVALVLLAACTREERAPDPILISVDTLRPDRIGAYGHHGARDVGQAIERGPTLAQLLRQRGYFGIGLSANPAADRPQQMHVGFDVFVGPEQLPGDGAADVTRIALKAAGLVDAGLPLFLWEHYLDPHFPYHPPASEDPPEAPTCRALARDIHRGLLTHGQAFTNFEGRAAAARDDCLALYDAEIAYTDDRIGALLDGLDELGRTERSIVVLTADHGESFGEMGLYFEHGPDVSDAGLRIPLVIAGTDLEPAVLDDAAQLEDLTPTLLGLLDVPAAERHCANDERYSLCRTPGEASVALHDRETDPTLERDLGDEHPERRAALEPWLAGAAAAGENELDDDALDALRELGYVE